MLLVETFEFHDEADTVQIADLAERLALTADCAVIFREAVISHAAVDDVLALQKWFHRWHMRLILYRDLISDRLRSVRFIVTVLIIAGRAAVNDSLCVCVLQECVEQDDEASNGPSTEDREASPP